MKRKLLLFTALISAAVLVSCEKQKPTPKPEPEPEIGRASCRERV